MPWLSWPVSILLSLPGSAGTAATLALVRFVCTYTLPFLCSRFSPTLWASSPFPSPFSWPSPRQLFLPCVSKTLSSHIIHLPPVPSLHPFVLSIHLSVHPSIHSSVCLSTYLSVRLLIHPSIHPYTHLSLHSHL